MMLIFLHLLGYIKKQVMWSFFGEHAENAAIVVQVRIDFLYIILKDSFASIHWRKIA